MNLTTRMLAFLGPALFLGVVSDSQGSTPSALTDLYMISDGGDGKRFWHVDASNGSATWISTLPGPEPFYRGLAQRPTDSTSVYTVSRQEEVDFGALACSCMSQRVERIDTTTGAVTSLPELGAIPGIPLDETYCPLSIAIPPQSPDTALLSGFNFAPSCGLGDHYLVTVDLETGLATGSVATASSIEAMTYSLDGTVLFGIQLGSKLVTIDPSTGIATEVSATYLPAGLPGLAIRPDDGVLFALEGGQEDQLVTISPESGTIEGIVGSLATIAPMGLAFGPSFASVPALSPSGVVVLVAVLLLTPVLLSRLRARKTATANGVRT